MKTEEKEERIRKACAEVIDLLADWDFTYGEGTVILTQCLASLITCSPDKRERNETMVACIMSLTESAARLEKATDAGVLKRPEEGGGE